MTPEATRQRWQHGNKISPSLYLCCAFTSPGRASVINGCVTIVQLMCPNTLVFVVFFCWFLGTAFKTQKEVVKAIFVNNIERLGHHYARVFDESW